MKIETHTRRPFDVNVVEVTPENVEQVAEWCGGTVAQGEYRHSKYKIQLPVVKVPGNGPHKGKSVDARIGYFVVEHNGSFRVYRPKQFEESFQNLKNVPTFAEGDLVRDKNNRMEGVVVAVAQVAVDFGRMGQIYDRDQLEQIKEFSPETVARLQAEDEATVGADKLNALRAAAEEAIRSGQGPSGVGCFPPHEGDLRLSEEPDNVGGFWRGMRVRVTLEANAFHEQFGTVQRLSMFGNAVYVIVDGTDGDTVPFQVDEIEPIAPKLEDGDLVETLVKFDLDGVTIPVGTNARVVGQQDSFEPRDDHNVHVLFSNGHYRWFPGYQLKKS
jgi:hypothetical protein